MKTAGGPNFDEWMHYRSVIDANRANEELLTRAIDPGAISAAGKADLLRALTTGEMNRTSENLLRRAAES